MSRPQSGPSGTDISAIIAQSKKQEENLTQENKRLKSILAGQDALIQKHREGLLEAAKASSELSDLEKQRANIKRKLAGQKSKLLVASSESSEVATIVEKSMDGDTTFPISNMKAGSVALAFIDKIEPEISALVAQCVESENLSIGDEELNRVIFSVSEALESAVNTGEIIEAPEDQVKRQALVIKSLMEGNEPEDEDEEEQMGE
jgi:multidrug efflux pump subunit AcrA (membrane-fusion protein)